MIIDLTLHDNSFLLSMSNYYLNQSPRALKKHLSGAKEISSAHGSFRLTNKFGLGACFTKQAEDDLFNYYSTALPEPNNCSALRQIVMTYTLLSRFVEEQSKKPILCEDCWRDQSFTLRADKKRPFTLEGYLFPWFTEKLSSLSVGRLIEINGIVKEEINRYHLACRGKIMPKSEITIMANSFSLKTDYRIGGIRWTNNTSEDLQPITSAGLHSFLHQEMTFVAFVALNTQLRNEPETNINNAIVR